jgi:hypothetical protein
MLNNPRMHSKCVQEDGRLEQSCNTESDNMNLCLSAGVFYPYNRGLLYTAQIVLYAMTAGISGYTSASLFRQMGGDRWARHLVLTCLIFAGPFFVMFCVLNTVAISYRCVCTL